MLELESHGPGVLIDGPPGSLQAFQRFAYWRLVGNMRIYHRDCIVVIFPYSLVKNRESGVSISKGFAIDAPSYSSLFRSPKP